MSDSIQPSRKNERVAEIRAMVDADFERISQTQDPYRILNLATQTDIATARARFERYERFYRIDNFHRFEDPELTRRAQEIRRAVSRAMVEINKRHNAGIHARRASQNLADFVLPLPDQDCVPLGDIYFRDGLTYLKLGDLHAAEDCLQRAVDHDPSRGILLAYLSYARFKLRNNDPSVVLECLEDVRKAARMEPENVEIFVIMARYGINIEDIAVAQAGVSGVEVLRPEHPKLAQLRERLAELSAPQT